MRVTGRGEVKGAAGRRGSARAGEAAGGAFAGLLGEGAAPVGGPVEAGGPAAAGALAALLALQEAPEPAAERRRRAMRRGEDVLDALDGLRRDILDGEVREDRLAALQDLAQGARAEAGDDPRLSEILGEIELRATVELAKLEAARGR